MKIGIVSQWYDPETGSAAVPASIARSLVKRGHEVYVITGFPNYPTGIIYPGYKISLGQTETLDGVNVHRVPLYPSHDSHPLRRALNFMSFALNSITLGLRKVRGVDVLLVYSTPATVGLTGLAFRTFIRKPFAVLVQDLWPDTLVASGMIGGRTARVVERALHLFCDRVYNRAEQVAAISQGMKDRIIDRGIVKTKVHVIHNWADESRFYPVDIQEEALLGTNQPLRLMYAGNLGDVQALDMLLEALHYGGFSSDDLLVDIIGNGVARDALEEYAQVHALDYVHFLGSMPVEEMASLIAESDIQLVSLKDDPLFHITIPSKIQATLACGKALLAVVAGDAARLVNESGAGYVVEPGNPVMLAEQIKGLLEISREELKAKGDSGLRYYKSHLSEEAGSSALESLLQDAGSKE